VSEIGEEKSNNPGFVAALEGTVSSRISERGTFSAFSGELYDVAVVETYIPIRQKIGRIDAVFELYTDVTSVMLQFSRAQVRLVLSLLVIFMLLYGALFLIVRNADQILNRQYKEIQISEAKVIREKQKAEEAAKAESEFLADMSHEIRTPMTAILGFTEILAEEGSDGGSRGQRLHAIETIRRNGEHLLTIINDILDLSKMEAGRLTVQRVAFSPTALAEEVLSLMRMRAEAKGLMLELEVDSSTPVAVESDPTRIRQILINLIGNAIDFTHAGKVRITSAYRDDPREPTLQFEVIDTGIGMSPYQINHMFEAFAQADTGVMRKHGGTGLGLTICKRLTALLGGSIEAESRPGTGSTFRVSFPVTAAGRERLTYREANLTPTEIERGPAAPKSAGAKLSCRVLVAEDSPDNRQLIAGTLREAGAEVEVAENGEIAIGKALEMQKQGGTIDVILMDMQMPVLDGPEAAKKLRSMGYRGPIIALTANAMPGDQQRCIEAGCDDYAAKPIDRQALVRLVAKHARVSADALPKEHR
jgi:signal transduction histidine kinase/ActR/RegA family two-component response regulator